MNDRTIEIDYTNHEGKRRIRRVQPTGEIKFMSTQWHPDDQWLFTAIDVEDNGAVKQFAFSGLNHKNEKSNDS